MNNTIIDIDPYHLTQKQKRKRSYHQVAARLLTKGVDSTYVYDKWNDIVHFVARNITEEYSMDCHLSNRFHIEKRLEGIDLMIAFQIRGQYYFLEHDILVDLAGEFTNYLNTASWKNDGKYNTRSPSRELIIALNDPNEEYKI